MQFFLRKMSSLVVFFPLDRAVDAIVDAIVGAIVGADADPDADAAADGDDDDGHSSSSGRARRRNDGPWRGVAGDILEGMVIAAGSCCCHDILYAYINKVLL